MPLGGTAETGQNGEVQCCFARVKIKNKGADGLGRREENHRSRAKPQIPLGHPPPKKGRASPKAPGCWSRAAQSPVPGLPVQCSLTVWLHSPAQSGGHVPQALLGEVAGRSLTTAICVCYRSRPCSRTTSASSPPRPSPPAMRTVTLRRSRRSAAAPLGAPSPPQGRPPSPCLTQAPEQHGSGALWAVPGVVVPSVSWVQQRPKRKEPRWQAPAASFSHIKGATS